MHLASSDSVERHHSVALSRVLLWFLLVPLILLVGCGAGRVAVALFEQLAPTLNQAAGLSLPARAVWSLTMGILTALLICYIWQPSLRRTAWHWMTLNVVSLSSGAFATLLTVGGISDSDVLPLHWLVPTVGIGTVLGGFQWLFLRQHMRRAGWWIAVMMSSWALPWFLLVGFAWLLSD
jgi:hypothetical protein